MDFDLLRARYATFAALALVFSIFLITALPWSPFIGAGVGLVSAGLLTAVLEYWLRLSLRRAALMQGESRSGDEPLRQYMQVFVDLQHKLLDAVSEKVIIESTLQVGARLLDAAGASFVPYDEWGQSLPALMHGEVPTQALQNWSARLTMPETRHECKNCQVAHGSPGCVLLPVQANGPRAVRCFRLQSAGREVGVVNFFFDQPREPNAETRQLLADMLKLTGKALENLHARDQEIAALRHLQMSAAPRSDLPVLLDDLLENVHQAFDVDFASLYIPGGMQEGRLSAPLLLSKTRGDAAAESNLPDLPFIEGIWRTVLASGHSISLENIKLNNRVMWKAFLAVPLVSRGEQASGVLVLGSNAAQVFSPRQLVLLETLAGQSALLLQNARLMVKVEYHAVVEERTRLAREIHDGLAQTLAFLKIQVSQMQNYLTKGDTERLGNTLQSNYRTLSDAYLDARQAIDNLRRAPSNGLSDWISQVATDFEQNSGQKVDLSQFNLSTEYPPNVQVQLIRIVQEALSNVRKHACASQVSIVGRQVGQDVFIEVTDNGKGFTPEQVDAASRYGLQGIRERAEMIGADFQILSKPGLGTTLSLRLPAEYKEMV